MTREEIIRIYCQISDELCGGAEWCWSGIDGPLERFAELIAAHEREECAKVCLDETPSLDGQLCAEAIRARGQE